MSETELDRLIKELEKMLKNNDGNKKQLQETIDAIIALKPHSKSKLPNPSSPEWQRLLDNLERTLKKYPDSPEAKKAKKLYRELKAMEVPDDHLQNVPLLSNPVLGVSNKMWIFIGIAGFLYMRWSLRRAFGPHPINNTTLPGTMIHDPNTCPDCQNQTHTEGQATILPYEDPTLYVTTWDQPTREL